ncbi:hypothetical protein EMCRGX_G020472 [Ephydatia muelleri]
MNALQLACLVAVILSLLSAPVSAMAYGVSDGLAIVFLAIVGIVVMRVPTYCSSHLNSQSSEGPYLCGELLAIATQPFLRETRDPRKIRFVK